MPHKPRRRRVGRTWTLVVVLAALVLAALILVFARGGGSRVRQWIAVALPGGGSPDTLPAMLNAELPFRYPASLYARRIQGNVTLRIFIDREGRVRPESTRVHESSGYASLDSAAVMGSQELRFVPAKQDGEPMAVSILFPVFFRHPDATPLPGDTVLQRRQSPNP